MDFANMKETNEDFPKVGNGNGGFEKEEQLSKIAFKDQNGNDNQTLAIPNALSKSKGEVLSGFSFSRFEAISEPSEKDQQPQQQKIQKPAKGDFSKKPISRVPTSTKIISSNKIIQEPVEVKVYTRDDLKLRVQKKHEYIFQCNYLEEPQIFERFTKFAVSKGMEYKIGDGEVTAIKKTPLYKSLLGLCFPNSSFEHQVYQLTCPVGKTGKISQLSGDDQLYYAFREDFLLSLWTEKYLVCGSPHQNLRHFMKSVNKVSQSGVNGKGKTKGRIDQLKCQIDRTLKKLYLENQSKKKSKQNSDQLKQKQQKWPSNHPEMVELRLKMKQIEEELRFLFQKETKKENELKKKRQSESKKKIDEPNGEESIQRGAEKVLVTPSMQRMLMNILYLHLDLEQTVKKYIIGPKDIGEFEKKKMIIKGSLSSFDIFKYLELDQFYKVHGQSTQSKDSVLPQSIKMLNSLKYSTYSSPSQILQLISIFENTLSKQIDLLNKESNGSKVKLQDHSNQDRTLLQFCIYCLIACDNRDIFPTIQTALVFSSCSDDSKSQPFQSGSLKAAKILRKGINFVQNQWEL